MPARRSRKFGVLWRYAGRSQERWPTHYAGLRIYGNPVGDVSHASEFRWAERCSLPDRVYHRHYPGAEMPYRLPKQAHILVVPKMDGSSHVNVNPALRPDRPDIGSDAANSKAPADAASHNPASVQPRIQTPGIPVLFAVASQRTIRRFLCPNPANTLPARL
jgi:hypothetical protein